MQPKNKRYAITKVTSPRSSHGNIMKPTHLDVEVDVPHLHIPSSKRLHRYGKSESLIGKLQSGKRSHNYQKSPCY